MRTFVGSINWEDSALVVFRTLENYVNRSVLAQRLGTNDRYIADAISEGSGGQTFLQFVNGYRLARHSGDPQANTPYLVAVFSGTVNEGTGNTPDTDVTLKKEVDNSFSAGGYTMKGTLTGLTNAEAAAAGAYILQTGGKWSSVTSDTEEHRKAYIPPCRAYIVANSTARMLNSSFDGETVGIDSIRTTDSDGTEH